MINMGQIMGRVGKMDMKSTASGMKICNMSMVTSKKFTKNGEKQEKITWHNVTLFSKLAEISEKYVKVGDFLYIQGEMDNQKYETGDGQQRIKHFLIAHDIRLMPKTKEHKPEPKAKAESDSDFNSVPFDDSEIPF